MTPQHGDGVEMEWNPRYLRYCEAHGLSPADMMARDDAAWPGGQMCGFVLWISEQWRLWCQERGRSVWDMKFPADHKDFDAWLLRRGPEKAH